MDGHKGVSGHFVEALYRAVHISSAKQDAQLDCAASHMSEAAEQQRRFDMHEDPSRNPSLKPSRGPRM